MLSSQLPSGIGVIIITSSSSGGGVIINPIVLLRKWSLREVKYLVWDHVASNKWYN